MTTRLLVIGEGALADGVAAGLGAAELAVARASAFDPGALGPEPQIVWAAGADGGRALRAAAHDARVAAVITVMPLAEDLIARLEAIRARPAAALGELGGLGTLVREHRASRAPAHLRCPVLIQVADEDDPRSVDGALRVAWSTGADVRHYPCGLAALSEEATLRRLVEHELVFLHGRLELG